MLLLLVVLVVIVPKSAVAANRHVPAWCLQIRQDVTVLLCEPIIQWMMQIQYAVFPCLHPRRRSGEL